MSISGADSEFSTPLQSQRTSQYVSSPTSFTSGASAYFSAQDVTDVEVSSDCYSMADTNEQLSKDPERSEAGEPSVGSRNGLRLQFTTRDQFFNDRARSIDFVLVYRLNSPNLEMAGFFEERRKIFHKNLEKEGLDLELDAVDDIPLRFVKIHAPFEVCTRYAEILKLRLPMRKLDPELRKNFVKRAGDFVKEIVEDMKVDKAFLRKRHLLRIPGILSFELSTPEVLLDMTDFCGRIFNFVQLDKTIFPPRNRHFTAIFSRNKEYLFDIRDDFFTAAVRARIIDFILRRKRYTANEEDRHACGIEKLLADGTYEAAYPIHEGELDSGTNMRALLYQHWASIGNIYKYQPLDYIKDYFGVKIGLYFAWLGFYTYMLIPASIVGVLCFVYAVSTINTHNPSNDICNGNLNITMCPLCDACNYWKLDETCFHAKFTYLVDNPATIFFTCFMSFWAALFLELWKRYSAEITHRWDLTGFDIDEEHPRPEYLARLSRVKKTKINLITGQYEPKPPFWKMRLPGVIVSISTVIFLVMMAIAAVFGVILYRMSVLAALSIYGDDVVTSYAIIFTSTTAAFINLMCILIFNQIYARVAQHLTELELPRTQTEFDDSLTLKIYLLQFINYYASIFYIAFFKGKIVGYPGDYNRLFGSRQEECSPGGCLLDLSVQLAIIMVGKQAVNSVMEMVFPLIWKWVRLLTVPEARRHVIQNVWPHWAKDFRLVSFDPRGLFSEYLEMVLQYGFVTIFVASFPLAPLFAFLNNILETRLDAKKILTHYRRPISQRVKDIGIWFTILDSLGKLAIITNAFIIAFTSNFIPELVYRHVISDTKSLDGFLNYSLAVFDIQDYQDPYRPKFETNSTFCRYLAYRNPPGSDREYKYSPLFWHILAARFAFIVVFQNVVVIIIMFIKWIIPDVPHRLKEQIRREAYVTNELIVSNELMRARGEPSGSDDVTPAPTSALRRQASDPTRSRSAPLEVRFRREKEEHTYL